MIAKFILEQGDSKDKVFILDNGTHWTLGRDPDVSDICINDKSVSRQHFSCEYIDKDGFFIENISKSNPIKVNGHELYERHLLQEGDKVNIGHSIYNFILESDAVVIEGLDDLESEAYFPKDEDIEENIVALQERSEKGSRETIFCDQEEAHDISLAEINFELLDKGRWLFKIINGPNSGAEFNMQSDSEYVVGKSSADCDIILHDVSISKQHLKITISKDEKIVIQDLNSSNGTFLNQNKLESDESKTLELTDVVTIGTTSFVIIDKESESETIISPVMPALQKYVEQTIEKEYSHKQDVVEEKENITNNEELIEVDDVSKLSGINNKILIGILVFMMAVVGLGAVFLFKGEDVVVEQTNYNEDIRMALKNYPDVQYSFNKSNSKLFLLGHVLTAVDKGQLMYNFKNLTFIKQISDNIIIDELVWKEMNQTLQLNSDFKGISMYSTRPGLFVLSGVLNSRDKAAALSEYIGINFPYLDRLENHVVVEEEVLNLINRKLFDAGFNNIRVQFVEGEVVLNGSVDTEQGFDFKRVVREIEKIRGVRAVRNFVAEQEMEDASLIDLTDRYVVTGNSKVDNVNFSVVINGKIITRGDALDNMLVTSIRSDVIFLESGRLKYKIEY